MATRALPSFQASSSVVGPLQAVPERLGRHAQHHEIRVAGQHRLEGGEERVADLSIIAMKLRRR